MSGSSESFEPTRMTNIYETFSSKVLYDGSQDPVYPNTLFVTDRYWSHDNVKRKMYISQVTIYDKLIVIYHVVDFHKEHKPMSRTSEIIVIHKQSGVMGHIMELGGPKDSMPLQKTFMYDHFLFILYIFKEHVKCYQHETGVITKFVAKYSKKEFDLNALTLFMRAWSRLPFGSKRTYDPTLLEHPKIASIWLTPIPVREYHKALCDLEFVALE